MGDTFQRVDDYLLWFDGVFWGDFLSDQALCAEKAEQTQCILFGSIILNIGLAA
ncbi:hypothetical protein D3C75_1247360 [compost metagenome]